ncbi:MAG TPA: diguanylate cyclase, partial [bacterium]|nr:diguanylate cyclase [bacterium]
MSHNSLTQFLKDEEGLIKGRWQSSMGALTSRAGQFHPDSKIYQEIRRLMMSLVSIVERKGSAEQAVDTEIKPIVSHLKNLQKENHLTGPEMVHLLFLMRDILKDLIMEMTHRNVDSRGRELEFAEGLDQVSSLLNRLGIVFFEGAMRLKHEDGISQQDVLAIEYALLYESTRQLAITDRLTGLFNFGYFHERLKEERMRAERYHRLLSLILFDLDHFKKYNDTNGHP